MNTELKRAPIGVFDSGLGGLTVAAAIAQALPDESMIYLGDTARVPYGNRSPETVVRYFERNAAFLQRQGVKLIVVACNTVSAQLHHIKWQGEVPVLGVIEPGARAALLASKPNQPLTVLGTKATVASGAYVSALQSQEPQRKVYQKACPLFVPLVEEGWLEHSVTRQVAEEYLGFLKDIPATTVILGCTHYPLLRPVIESIVAEFQGPEARVVDTAKAVANEVVELLNHLDLRCPAEAPKGIRKFYVTDSPEQSEIVAGRFWGENVTQADAPLHFEHVDIDICPKERR